MARCWGCIDWAQDLWWRRAHEMERRPACMQERRRDLRRDQAEKGVRHFRDNRGWTQAGVCGGCAGWARRKSGEAPAPHTADVQQSVCARWRAPAASHRTIVRMRVTRSRDTERRGGQLTGARSVQHLGAVVQPDGKGDVGRVRRTLAQTTVELSGTPARSEVPRQAGGQRAAPPAAPPVERMPWD